MEKWSQETFSLELAKVLYGTDDPEEIYNNWQSYEDSLLAQEGVPAWVYLQDEEGNERRYGWYVSRNSPPGTPLLENPDLIINILDKASKILAEKGIYNEGINFWLAQVLHNLYNERVTRLVILEEKTNQRLEQGIDEAAQKLGKSRGELLDELDERGYDFGVEGLGPPIYKGGDVRPLWNYLPLTLLGELVGYREGKFEGNPDVLYQQVRLGLKAGRQYDPDDQAWKEYLKYISDFQDASDIIKELNWLIVSMVPIEEWNERLFNDFVDKVIKGWGDRCYYYISFISGMEEDWLLLDSDIWDSALDYVGKDLSTDLVQEFVQRVWRSSRLRSSIVGDPGLLERVSDLYRDVLVSSLEDVGGDLTQRAIQIVEREREEDRGELLDSFNDWVGEQIRSEFVDLPSSAQFRRLRDMREKGVEVGRKLDPLAEMNLAFDVSRRISKREDLPYSALTHGGVAEQPASEFTELTEQPPTRTEPWEFYEPLRTPRVPSDVWNHVWNRLREYLVARDDTLTDFAKTYTSQEVIDCLNEISSELKGYNITPWGVAYVVAQILQLLRSPNRNVLETIRRRLVDLERTEGGGIRRVNPSRRFVVSMPRSFLGVPANRIVTGPVKVEPSMLRAWYRRMFGDFPPPTDPEGNLLPMTVPEGEPSLTRLVGAHSDFNDIQRVNHSVSIFNVFARMVEDGILPGELWDTTPDGQRRMTQTWIDFCRERKYSPGFYTGTDVPIRLSQLGIYIDANALTVAQSQSGMDIARVVNDFRNENNLPPQDPTHTPDNPRDITDMWRSYLAKEYPGDDNAELRDMLFYEGAIYVNRNLNTYRINVRESLSNLSRNNAVNLDEIDRVLEPAQLGDIPPHIRRVQRELVSEMLRGMVEDDDEDESLGFRFHSVSDVAEWLWYGARDSFSDEEEALELAHKIVNRIHGFVRVNPATRFKIT